MGGGAAANKGNEGYCPLFTVPVCVWRRRCIVPVSTSVCKRRSTTHLLCVWVASLGDTTHPGWSVFVRARMVQVHGYDRPDWCSRLTRVGEMLESFVGL